MPSRPVLIGRGLVTHTPTHHKKTHASTTQNLNQQPTPHHPTHTRGTQGGHGNNTTGSHRYGGHSGRETPGPIPNPEVKPASAHGTAPDRMWESRTPPNIFYRWGSSTDDPHRYRGASSAPVTERSL
jgi:hypothetical protein